MLFLSTTDMISFSISYLEISATKFRFQIPSNVVFSQVLPQWYLPCAVILSGLLSNLMALITHRHIMLLYVVRFCLGLAEAVSVMPKRKRSPKRNMHPGTHMKGCKNRGVIHASSFLLAAGTFKRSLTFELG